MADISAILSQQQLDTLRAAWNDPVAQKAFKDKMGSFLPTIYPPSLPLLGAVKGIFYDQLPPDNAPPPRDALSERDRERIIIALLAEREINSNIALHMFLALMLEISPAEIAHILLLAGVYDGIPGFADGIRMEKLLLEFLQNCFDANGAPNRNIKPDALFDELEGLSL